MRGREEGLLTDYTAAFAVDVAWSEVACLFACLLLA
jgi:hypothetical protein